MADLFSAERLSIQVLSCFFKAGDCFIDSGFQKMKISRDKPIEFIRFRFFFQYTKAEMERENVPPELQK